MQFQRDQEFIDRFVAACQADRRVLAATIWGSHVTGTADRYSDLDLGLITTNEGYERFANERTRFVRILGEPVFLEDFDSQDMVFFIFPDGTEGHLTVGSERQFQEHRLGFFGSPHEVLFDRSQILSRAEFPRRRPTRGEQLETLRRTVYWFWHELSHCIVALARGQLWWAYGQLETLRRHCVVLARLHNDFEAGADIDEPYEKIDLLLSEERLSAIEATCCPLEWAPILQAVMVVVDFYRRMAKQLCRTHEIAYPEALDVIMSERLASLG